MENNKLELKKSSKIYLAQQVSMVLFIIAFLIFSNNPGILSHGLNPQTGFFIFSAILLLILSIIAIVSTFTGIKPKHKVSYFITYLGLIVSILLLSL